MFYLAVRLAGVVVSRALDRVGVNCYTVVSVDKL